MASKKPDIADVTTSDSEAEAFKLSRIPQGVTIIGLVEHLPQLQAAKKRQDQMTTITSLMPHVRADFERLAKQISERLGMPFPEVDGVLSLYPGNSRQVEAAQRIAAAGTPLKKPTAHHFEACGIRDGFNWTSDEAYDLMKQILQSHKNWWVTFALTITLPITPAFVSSIDRIRQLAKKHGVWLMVFIDCPKGFETSGLNELGDEYIEASRAESDPGCRRAFKTDQLCALNFDQGLKPPVIGMAVDKCNVFSKFGVSSRLVGIL